MSTRPYRRIYVAAYQAFAHSRNKPLSQAIEDAAEAAFTAATRLGFSHVNRRCLADTAAYQAIGIETGPFVASGMT